MQKAVATPYIIALILGIIVVVVVGFLFFIYSGRGGSTAQEAFCRAKFVSYCTQWSATGYTTLPGNKEFYAANPDCNDFKTKAGFPASTDTTTEKTACQAALL